MNVIAKFFFGKASFTQAFTTARVNLFVGKQGQFLFIYSRWPWMTDDSTIEDKTLQSLLSCNIVWQGRDNVARIHPSLCIWEVIWQVLLCKPFLFPRCYSRCSFLSIESTGSGKWQVTIYFPRWELNLWPLVWEAERLPFRQCRLFYSYIYT